jgi:6,7-dimethyl-8-ribityllumazine synthase
MFISNVTKNSLITGHFKKHGQIDKNACKYIMLRQEMESYPIIIGACNAHTTKTTANKMKTHDGESGWYIGKQIVMLLPMGVMPLEA